MSSIAIAKYTQAGIEKEQQALQNNTTLKIAKFRVSKTVLDLTQTPTPSDLVDYWIEKPITEFKKTSDTRLEITLKILANESTQNGASFALYLEDGTPFIIATPANTQVPRLEQKYILQIDFTNGANAFDFIYIEEKMGVVDNLETDDPNLALSARMGKWLNSKIDSNDEFMALLQLHLITPKGEKQ